MKFNYSLDQINTVATKLLQQFTGKTILFYGEMGAGKTTLIKALVKQLGSDDIVSSPTFSLINEYKTSKETIFHFDFYRIENELEALDFGIEDYFNTNAWLFIEWPENIPNLVPDDAQALTISTNNDGTRALKLDKKRNLTN